MKIKIEYKEDGIKKEVGFETYFKALNFLEDLEKVDIKEIDKIEIDTFKWEQVETIEKTIDFIQGRYAHEIIKKRSEKTIALYDNGEGFKVMITKLPYEKGTQVMVRPYIFNARLKDIMTKTFIVDTKTFESKMFIPYTENDAFEVILNKEQTMKLLNDLEIKEEDLYGEEL